MGSAATATTITFTDSNTYTTTFTITHTDTARKTDPHTTETRIPTPRPTPRGSIASFLPQPQTPPGQPPPPPRPSLPALPKLQGPPPKRQIKTTQQWEPGLPSGSQSATTYAPTTGAVAAAVNSPPPQPQDTTLP